MLHKLLYLTLYHLTDFLFKFYNICEREGKECAGTKCGAEPIGCCFHCKHLAENGCTVKSLSCKLWTCPSLSKKLEYNHFVFWRVKNYLYSVAFKHSLLHTRTPMEASLRYAKSNRDYRKKRGIRRVGKITTIILKKGEIK